MGGSEVGERAVEGKSKFFTFEPKFIGILVSLCAYFVVLLSWSYARGFYGVVGIPTYFFTFLMSLELFAVEGGMVFAVGVLCALTTSWLERYFTKGKGRFIVEFILLILLGGLFAVVMVLGHDLNYNAYVVLVTICTLLVFSLFGTVFRDVVKFSLDELWGVIAQVFLITFVLSTLSFGLGRVDAENLMSEKRTHHKVSGQRVSVLHSRIPDVRVISNRPLGFFTPPKSLKGNYVYEAGRQCFIKMMWYSAGVYFFVEKSRPGSRAALYIVDKSAIVEVDVLPLFDSSTIGFFGPDSYEE